jgi:hypothetical protein
MPFDGAGGGSNVDIIVRRHLSWYVSCKRDDGRDSRDEWRVAAFFSVVFVSDGVSSIGTAVPPMAGSGGRGNDSGSTKANSVLMGGNDGSGGAAINQSGAAAAAEAAGAGKSGNGRENGMTAFCGRGVGSGGKSACQRYVRSASKLSASSVLRFPETHRLSVRQSSQK